MSQTRRPVPSVLLAILAAGLIWFLSPLRDSAGVLAWLLLGCLVWNLSPGHRTFPSAVLTAASAALIWTILAGVEPTAGAVDLRYDVSDYTADGVLVRNAAGEWVPDHVAQDQIRGTLESLFGTPSAPGYLVTQEWFDEGYNPSFPQRPPGDYDAPGSGEITDEQWEEIVEGNRQRFASQIEILTSTDPEASLEERAEAYGAVRIPAWMPNLQKQWNLYYGQFLEGVYVPYEDSDFVADMVYLFENWYPSLRESSELYRRQCMHCHGVNGGGEGTTAPYLDPRPRDYRKGIFKFASVDNKGRPRREDLVNILRSGLYGSAMPSFERFTAAELHGLVDYVRLLSIRGEVEEALADEHFNEGALRLDVVNETYARIWGEWQSAADNFVAYGGEVPPATPEMIDRGRQLFLQEAELKTIGGKADCADCHGRQGRGKGFSVKEVVEYTPGDPNADLDALDHSLRVRLTDEAVRVGGGEESLAGVLPPVPAAGEPPATATLTVALPPEVHAVEDRTDEKVKLKAATVTVEVSADGMEAEITGLSVERVTRDEWGYPVRPRDYNRGIYRAGSRPIDIYRRIYTGINGTPMPGHANYEPEDIWALTHYVRHVSASGLRAAAGR